jgi:hypothetical protein
VGIVTAVTAVNTLLPKLASIKLLPKLGRKQESVEKQEVQDVRSDEQQTVLSYSILFYSILFYLYIQLLVLWNSVFQFILRGI